MIFLLRITVTTQTEVLKNFYKQKTFAAVNKYFPSTLQVQKTKNTQCLFPDSKQNKSFILFCDDKKKNKQIRKIMLRISDISSKENKLNVSHKGYRLL